MQTLPRKIPTSKYLTIEYTLGTWSSHCFPMTNQWANLGIRDCVPIWFDCCYSDNVTRKTLETTGSISSSGIANWRIIWMVFLMLIFLFWEREREREREGGSAQVRGKGQRGRDRIASSLHAQHRAWCGARTQDCEILTSAAIKSQTLNRLSHPGTSWLFFR